MKNMGTDSLILRYPQLKLPVREGMKDTPEYRNAVLRGRPVDGEPLIHFTQEDSLTTADTPAGEAELLFLSDRSRFVHVLQALAYRCEPVPIPDSVGAITIRGLINWEKIRQHRERYLADGGTDWSAEFKRFTSEKSNYQDTLIVLSSGNYSNIPAEQVGISSEEWKKKSLIIRQYHELTHFVCRSLFPDNIVPIRDEVLADLVGLVEAFGEYDIQLAKKFLGIEDGVFREGGRLSHYVHDDIAAAVSEAEQTITRFAALIHNREKQDLFEWLLNIF